MKTILDSIGNTPLVKLDNLSQYFDCEVYAKVESFNPGSSVKDRLAKALVEDAEERGVLTKGKTIVEASSGNTGISIAMVAAIKGYKTIIAMPETMSVERRKILLAFGAKLELTPRPLGMTGSINKAKDLVVQNDNFISLGQFDNPANPKVHYETTAPEIIGELPSFDYFVAGVGTGGTITGVGRYLKEHMPNTKIIAVEPKESSVLSGEKPGPHKIQGIGAGFIPKVLDMSVIDGVVPVSFEEAKNWLQRVASGLGILCGISSGAAIAAIENLSKMESIKGKKIVVVLPDSGERYLSTEAFK